MMCESKISKVLLCGLQYGKMLTGRTLIFQTQVQAKAFSYQNETSENPMKLLIVESMDKCRSFKEVDVTNPKYEEYAKLCQRVNMETGLPSLFFPYKEKHIGYRVNRESITFSYYSHGADSQKK